jgi:pheromone shutdown protein TraB
LAWIGVQGQQNSMLLFTPLQNLVYIFGYNITLSNSSLFSVYNIGFAYDLIPAILFGILMFVGKKKPGTISSKIKRFVLYDITFAWLMINGFLIAYGLSLAITSTGSISGITAGGIVASVLYFIAMIFVSYRSFYRDSSL